MRAATPAPVLAKGQTGISQLLHWLAMRTQRVFVYGTLKRGFPNFAEWMDGAGFVGVGRTVQRFPLYVAGSWKVPYLLDTPEKGFVVSGEVFALDASGLARLDILESVGQEDGYFRRQIEINCSGKILRAWVYLIHKLATGEKRGPLAEYPLDSGYVGRSARHSGDQSGSFPG